MSPLDATPMSSRLVPADVAPVIDALGKKFDENVLAKMTEVYTARLREIAWPSLRVDMDRVYGDHERHRLDVYVPEEAGAGRPAVIFFHGGGFVRGDKNTVADLIYANVGRYFASNGIVCLNATYRLAPAFKWPSGGEDVGAALAWAKAHVAEYGGDPGKIFLMGQSAGASHVSTYAFRSFLHPADGPGIAGAILLSGVYAFDPKGPADIRVAYYGEDDSAYANMMTLGNVDRADFPVFAAIAEYDMAMFETVAYRLIAELIDNHGARPRFKQMLGHNHVSYIMGLGTDDATIGPDLLDFVRNGR